MKTVLFLGPTIDATSARAYLARSTSAAKLPADARVQDDHPDWQMRAPVAQGDVLRALRDGARRIGIIDGYFDQVPSVWHKEILFALSEGALVFGASSMGALRAAELSVFGMIGVGRVFEMYRDGVLEDDDEVAISHSSAESGYRALSEAMVNIRDRLTFAVGERIVDDAQAAALVAIAKALPYRARSYSTLVSSARAAGLDAAMLARLQAFAEAPHVSLKRRDALEMLDRMARGEDRVASAAVHVERTVFLERLRQTVAAERDAPALKP